jgi:predicted protein tyrosine phosphatase
MESKRVKIERLGVKVLSKPEFNDLMANHRFDDSNIENLKTLALISINDTHGQWSASWFDKDHTNVLRLWFDDIEKDLQTSPTNPDKCLAFTVEQAKQVFDFINANYEKDFIIHCSAGISRSGAVGAFVNDYFGWDRTKFDKDNPYIHPNGRVSRMLNGKVWKDKLKK